jgi:hypothetical protein
MKRIIIFVVIGIVVIFGLTRVFNKGKSKGVNKTTVSSSKAVKGKTTGAIKTKTKEEIAAEQKNARRAERKRLRELKRQQRREARARRLAGYLGRGSNNYSRRTGVRGVRGRMTAFSSRRVKTTSYQLKAIFIIGDQYYAMIEGRNYSNGDDVMGRKIVEILSDRIIIDESGQRREVKIGESVLPNLITTKTIK